jgi:hypothetical protein
MGIEWSAWNKRSWSLGITTGSSNVIVGVIDTGIRASHQDLVNRVDTGLSRDFTLPFPHIPATVTDPRGHGTQVAGIIGAETNVTPARGIAGINWNVTLVSLRVSMTNFVGAGGLQIANAVDYATGTFATNRPIRILNFSGGNRGGENIALRQAIMDFPGLFLTAADNANVDHDVVIDFPTNYARDPAFNNVISVSRTDWTDNRANNSAWGRTSVSIFAPGVDILTTTATSNTAYARVGGTSFATPMVAGVAALMLSIQPALTPAQIKATILGSATTVSGLWNLCVSRGRLNAFEALKSAPFDINFSGVLTVRPGAVLPNTLVIPEELNNITVSKIGASAFANRTNLLAVTLPARITHIGNFAFSGCSGITSISLPSNLTHIGNNAFEGCTALKTLQIPRGLTNIGIGAFNGCPLKTITMPSGWGSTVFSIRDNHIMRNNNLELVVGSNNSAGALYFNSIGPDAFNGRGLTYLAIPSSVSSISPSAFYGNPDLDVINVVPGVGPDIIKSIDGCIIRVSNGELILGGKNAIIPPGVTSIVENAFYGRNISSITIPASVTHIRMNAFSGAANLHTVEFASGSQLQWIGYRAFANTTNLSRIIIPAGVTTVGADAFFGWTRHQVINVPYASQSALPPGWNRDWARSQNFNVNPVIGWGANNLASHPYFLIANNEIIALTDLGRLQTALTIPANITRIRMHAFEGNTTLQTLTFEPGSQLQWIGYRAFAGATNLSSITIPSNVRTVGYEAFLGWTSSQTIYVPYSQGALPSGWSVGWHKANATVVWL